MAVDGTALAAQLNGLNIAIQLLIRQLHLQGSLNAADLSPALKGTFNDPNAQFERQDYQYLARLAGNIDEFLAGRG